MIEKDILNIICNDPWMMSILHTAEKNNLPNWIIGAGFVRNKVWDYLHGHKKEQVDTNDIDMVYFDQENRNEDADVELGEKLKLDTGINWEVTNMADTHEWDGLPAHKSIEDGISHWPETASAIGVTLKNNELKLIAPYGVEDLANLIIRMSPKFYDKKGMERVKERIQEKQWLKKYPKLKLVE